MVSGYKQLAQELGGLYTVGSLRVLDSLGRLPLTRQWHEGQRAWDLDEVRRFKAEKLAKREARHKDFSTQHQGPLAERGNPCIKMT